MLRSRFGWKLYAGAAASILLAAALVGGLVARGVERQTLAEIETKLQGEARLLREIAAGRWQEPSDLQARIDPLGDELETRLTVIRADGKVLADSDEDPARMADHSDRPEIIEALAGGHGSSTRFSNTVKQRMRYFALRVEEDGGVVGVVRVSVPLIVPEQSLRRLRRDVALGALAAAVVALGLAFVLARRFTRPLESMTEAAAAIAGGAYGQKVPVSSRDELGELAGAFNVMSDKLRESSRSMAADRHKLQAILSSMVEGVVAVDRDERILHLNAVALRLLEISAEPAVGRRVWEVTRIREVAETLAETLRREAVVHRVVRLPGNPDRFFDFHASPLQAGGGVIAGAVLVVDDVTRLRRLETIRRDFVGNVSHELKTPVTAIRGMVETLLDDPDTTPEVRNRFLGKIQGQSVRLSNLVTDLLALSRLESEDARADFEPIDVLDAVASSIRSLQPAVEAKSVRLETELAPEPLWILGEEESLQQAVSNLLDNAVKYSPEGGKVTLRAQEDRPGRVVVEVEDEGPGIEPRHQERIFERFYRVDAARSRALGGTGLGLAIVKHVALTFGGDVACDSVPGKGSTFRICLPSSGSRETACE